MSIEVDFKANITFGTLTKGSKEVHDKMISEIANSMKDLGDPVDTLRLLFTEISSIANKSQAPYTILWLKDGASYYDGREFARDY